MNYYYYYYYFRGLSSSYQVFSRPNIPIEPHETYLPTHHTPSYPTTMASTFKAIVCVAPGKAEVQTLPVPQVGKDTILVRIKAVALNPTDWKSIDGADSVGLRIGCDYAGVVEEVGAEVKKPFEKGDRVCGMLFGG